MSEPYRSIRYVPGPPPGWRGGPASGSACNGLAFVGSLVRESRLLMRLTQSQLGELVGLAQSTISKIESGRLYHMRWQRFAVLIDALEPGLRRLIVTGWARATWSPLGAPTGSPRPPAWYADMFGAPAHLVDPAISWHSLVQSSFDVDVRVPEDALE